MRLCAGWDTYSVYSETFEVLVYNDTSLSGGVCMSQCPEFVCKPGLLVVQWLVIFRRKCAGVIGLID